MTKLSVLAKDQRGFTLTEMLVASAMMGFVLSAALLGLQVGSQAADVTTGRAEAQANVRFAMDRLLGDVRAAGYDPTNNGFDPVENIASTSVTLRTDLNANGTIDAPVGTCDPSAQAERVRYRLVGTDLMRSADPANAACEAVMIGGVQSLTFTYQDATGATTATAASVRAVIVAVKMAPESLSGTQKNAMAASMTDQARMRNR